MGAPTSTAQHADRDQSAALVSARVNARQVVRASYEASALTFEEYAKKVVAYAESSEEKGRRELTRRRLDVVRDAWGPLLKQALENWLDPDIKNLVIGAHGDHLDLSRNPAKHIWQELSVLYKLPPKRTTTIDGAKTDDAEAYQKLLEDTDFDIWWQLVEFLLNACNEVVIWPDVITRNGKPIIKHRLATGATLTAVATDEDTTEIECWVVVDQFRDLDGVSHERWTIWTDDWHGQFERDAKSKELFRTDRVDDVLVSEEQDDDGNDFTVINPYGRQPQVRIRLTPWQDIVWDQTSGEDLMDLTVHGGIDRAMYRYHQKVSGFKQGVATGDFDKIEKTLLDPGYLIKVPGDGTNFTVVDWQLNLLDRLKAMDVDEQAAAAAKGINPQRYKRDTDYQTASGAMNAERGLAEYRERNRPILARAEAQYYRNLCMVASKHQLEGVPSEEARLEVEHHPLNQPQDPMAQIEVDAKEIALAVESHKTVLKRRHPAWTDDQIDEYQKRVLEDIAEVNDAKARHNVPNDPTNESASAEENGAKGPVVRDAEQSPPGAPQGNTGP